MTAKHYTQRDTAVADVTLGAAQVQYEGGLGVLCLLCNRRHCIVVVKRQRLHVVDSALSGLGSDCACKSRQWTSCLY